MQANNTILELHILNSPYFHSHSTCTLFSISVYLSLFVSFFRKRQSQRKKERKKKHQPNQIVPFLIQRMTTQSLLSFTPKPTPQIRLALLSKSTMQPPTTRHVAVIGAGAAGLVAARELRREGHKVVVFERGDQVGGTWVYTPKVESDPIGSDPNRAIVHSSLYQSLRTNLPREVMGFRDYPFVAKEGDEERDPRTFPGHREVLMYLKEFGDEFGVCGSVRFESEVVFVGLVEGGKWEVKSRSKRGEDFDEVYDAVVVCNGHYTEPRIAHIPGIDTWKGTQIHSHNYRTPEPYRGQVVIIIGSSASAVDISRDMAGVAKEVHIASRSLPGETFEKMPGYDNMWLHSMVKSLNEDGNAVFPDGSVVCADIILHCTGYIYNFPFLETNGIVTVDDNRVEPLYKHVFPPALAPSLSFVGLPWKVVPFPLFELQSKWIAALLSNRITLPSEEEMMEDVRAFHNSLEASGIPKRYTHNMADYQFEYDDWLAAQCGCPGSEEWRMQMYSAVSKYKRARPETYRDEWEDDHLDLLVQAHEDFKKYTSNEVGMNI